MTSTADGDQYCCRFHHIRHCDFLFYPAATMARMAEFLAKVVVGTIIILFELSLDAAGRLVGLEIANDAMTAMSVMV